METPRLARRDRSIVTVAALIARNQTIEMSHYFNLALDNGVKPREISEIITHLAFYSGWANAMSAAAVARDVFAQRKIGTDQLPPASPKLLPLDKDAEEKRATAVGQQFGKVAPGLVQNTTDVLFRDLWLRPDLAPRDRSLVTVSALIAPGHVAQIRYHNGLTQQQAGESRHATGFLRWLAECVFRAAGCKGCLRKTCQIAAPQLGNDLRVSRRLNARPSRIDK